MGPSRRFIAAITFATALAFPMVASACLNDTSSASAESEFRSRYEGKPPPTQESLLFQWRGWLGLAAGVGLLSAALFIRYRRPPAGGV